MTDDPLDLIAEARERQKRAEQYAAYWKERAEHADKRTRKIIDYVKSRHVELFTMHEGGIADWDQIERVVKEFANVLRNPYAAFDDDDNDWDRSHAAAERLLTWRIQNIIEAAVAESKAK